MKIIYWALGSLTGIIAAGGLWLASPIVATDAAADLRSVDPLGKDLLFQPNYGQWPDSVEFVGEASSYRAALSVDRVRLLPRDSRRSAVEIVFRGATTDQLQGLAPGTARSHYLKGADAAGWVTEVPSYAQVVYRSVYPGIDMVFYGVGTRHEYDFQVAPGSDPDQIQMVVAGTSAVSLSEDGNLSLHSPLGVFTLQRPIAYQNGGAGRIPIECRFEIEPLSETQGSVIRFDVGAYDRRRTLVIDPILSYASYLGGGLSEQGTAAVVAANGEIFVAGTTDSTSFPLGPNPFQGELADEEDLFVARLSADGATLLSATYIGGTRSDIPLKMALSAEGRPTIVGATSSTDFPLETPFQPDYGGGARDGFVLQLNTSLSGLEFSSYLGGGSTDSASALAFGDGGAIWTGGFTRSQDFPQQDAFQTEQMGRDDGFVARISSDGGVLEFSTYLGGGGNDTVNDISFSDGRLLATGATQSDDFPTLDPIQAERGGRADIFVTLIANSAIEKSTFLGGSGDDNALTSGIAADGSLVVAGQTASSDFPLLDPIQPQLAGGADVCIAVLSPALDAVVFSTYLGGLSGDSAFDLLLDGGEILVTGSTNSSDFPLAGTVLVNQPGSDLFLARISPATPALVFSTLYGGSGSDVGLRLSRNQNGSVVLIGTTSSSDLHTVSPIQADPGSRGVFRSTNGAQNWQPAGTGLADPNIFAVAVAPSSPLILYAGTGSAGVSKSTDGTATWTTTGLDSGSIRAIVVDPNDADIVYAGGFGSVSKSVDGGEEWEAFTTGLPADTILDLAIDPSDPQTLYAATSTRGVFTSTDGGQEWRAINGGLTEDVDKQAFSVAVDPTDSNRVYLGTNGTVFISTSKGQIWEPTSFTGVGPIAGLVVDRNTGDVFASGFANPVGAVIARSSGQDPEGPGITWVAQPLGSFDDPVLSSISDLTIAPANSSILYAATLGSGVFKTTDSGRTPDSWDPVNNNLGSLQIQAVAASSGDTVLAATPSGTDALLTMFEENNTFYLPQVADGRLGRIQFQTSIVFVNTGGDSSVKVEFFGVQGSGESRQVVPLELTFPQLGTGSSFEFELKSGEAFSATTEGAGLVKVGYARVTTGDGVDGTAVFTRSDVIAAQPLFEGGVPAVKAHDGFVFLLDSIGDQNTGVALVNTADDSGGSPEGGNAEVKLTLFDEDNNRLQEVTVALKPGEHRARFVNELFPDIALQVSEMRGILTVSSDQPIAAVTLRQREPEQDFPFDVPTLTPFPVLLFNNLSTVSYFPQVGHGTFANSIFETTFAFGNAGAFANITLELFDAAGAPLEMTLEGVPFSGGPVTDSTFQFQLPSQDFVFLKTSGDEGLRVGYARITSTGFGLNPLGVGGTAVFSEKTNDSGVTLFEAGVAATIPRRRFSIFLDSLGKRDTGLAMVNTSSDEAATVQLRLFDLEFNLIAEREIVLQPGEHLPRFVFELFDGLAAAREMQGVVAVDSTLPLAAVTLRQSNDLSIEFPQEVPTLTIFPVIPGVP